jgi:hypothetical protein
LVLNTFYFNKHLLLHPHAFSKEQFYRGSTLYILLDIILFCAFFSSKQSLNAPLAQIALEVLLLAVRVSKIPVSFLKRVIDGIIT